MNFCRNRVSANPATAIRAICGGVWTAISMASKSEIPAIKLTTARGMSPAWRRFTNHSATRIQPENAAQNGQSPTAWGNKVAP